MKKRIMVIGPENIENSALVALIEKKEPRKAIGSVIYQDETIQVPSSYMRSPSMLKHIIANQQKASCILMLLNVNRENKSRVYPPNIAKSFRLPRIGVLLMNLREKNEEILVDLASCEKELENAGVDNIYRLDIEDKENCKDFLNKINHVKREGIYDYSKI